MPSAQGMKCRKCGHESKKRAEMKSTKIQEKKDIVVIEKDESTLPTIERACPQCGNERAYFWLIQTRASDEPPTRFFRCTRCRHTWREYS